MKLTKTDFRRFSRASLASVLVTGVLLAVGCSGLQPVDLTDETTLGPAQAPLWQSLEKIRSDDWNILLNTGSEALDWRLTAIDSATESIDLQTFLFTFDTVGSLVIDHLLQAAGRGVLVKILVDDSFLLAEDEVLLALAEHPNIEYRIYNPFKRRSDGLISRQILNLAEFSRLDHRMHNKVMVVDNRIAIVGGRNLADEYFGLHTVANFRDMELLVGGSIVPELAGAFDLYWNDDWSLPIELLSHLEHDLHQLDSISHLHGEEFPEHRELGSDDLMRRWQDAVASAVPGEVTLFVDKPPEKNPALLEEAPVQVANELAEVFDNANEEIIIISAYLIPTPGLESAIERAVDRGVRVRILTNSIQSNNHLTAHSAYRNHIEELMRGGAELHEVRIDARDRFKYMLPPSDDKSLALHAKVLVIDRDQVFVGSANLDPRSLRINTEMGLLVTSEELNRQLRQNIEPDLSTANSWSLRFDDEGEVMWVNDEVSLTVQPAASFMQSIEDWFFAHLPIEDKM